MRFSERVRIAALGRAAETAPSGETAVDDAGTPIAGYDDLDEKVLIAHFRDLTQVELAEVEAYERGHRSRRVVLNKLRYMRSPEPVAGYDALEPAAIVRLLEQGDSASIRAIRDYEGKFRGRRQVLSAAAQALPNAALNVGEQHRRDEKAERTRTGIQDRRDLTG
jgi:hypothetical protein